MFPTPFLHTAQEDQIDRGTLQINVTSLIRNRPIENARVSISYTGEPGAPIEQLVTNVDGQTESVDLPTPPIEYSMDPSEYQPYAEYTVTISAEGFLPVDVSGTQLLPSVQAIQPIRLEPEDPEQRFENTVIDAHTLYGNYPPKIPESEIKPVNQSGEIVLSRVVVPEYVVVHNGAITDRTAQDYYERYRDYIKNVASSEIYATWPKETITANVLAIMSFTLNRVYTEWYRNRGYDFTITSQTAYDHKWTKGRNYFAPIEEVVDEIFTQYLSRPNVKQPILAQYCDGQRTTCPNWLSQWGSKYLGDQNYSAIDIIRYYYGEDMYINSAEEISGVPASWPRYDLEIGASGEKVRQMQDQLNEIARVYTNIPSIENPNGIYGEDTQMAVRKFQQIFDLPQTGIVDYRTWYKIQEIYVGVTRIAEFA